MKKGEQTFKDKGMIPLQNRLKFNLMISEDAENQSKRDKWVADKLEGLISDGRADKLAKGVTYDPPKRDKSRRGDITTSLKVVDGKVVVDKNGAPRIEIPWDY